MRRNVAFRESGLFFREIRSLSATELLYKAEISTKTAKHRKQRSLFTTCTPFLQYMFSHSLNKY